MPSPKALLVLSILSLLSLPAAAGIPPDGATSRAETQPGVTGLYLADADKLSTVPVSEGSAPFPAQAKLSIALVWLVGTWQSAPLGAPLNYGGNINFSLWARASSPGQLMTRFQVYFGTNGARGDAAYSTNSDRIGTTPTELKGTASGVTLKAGAGDTITFMVYVSERGSGGELVYGGGYPSRIELNLWPVKLNLTYDSKPGALKIMGDITDIWGSQDIDTVFVGILGSHDEPVNMTSNMTGFAKLASLDGADLETEGNRTVFTYTWRYDTTSIKAGTYHVIVWVTTFSNSTAVDGFMLSLRPTAAGGLLSGPVAMAAAVVIVVAVGAGAAFYYMRKSGRGIGLRAKTAQ